MTESYPEIHNAQPKGYLHRSLSIRDEIIRCGRKLKDFQARINGANPNNLVQMVEKESHILGLGQNFDACDKALIELNELIQTIDRSF